MKRALTFLKISRPGLWFQTLWLYALPFAAGADWRDPRLWLGLVYVTWPLNALVYGWNDLVDIEIDRDNPRKDSWLFGARANLVELRSLIRWLTGVQLLFTFAFVFLAGWKMLGWIAAMLAVNASYNARIGGLRGRPPFDLINPLGYLLVTQLPVWLCDLPAIPWQTWLYLALFCLQAQLIGEIMDYWPDRESGRVTSATRLGVRPTKLLVIAVVALETALLLAVFRDYFLGAILGLGVVWLSLDLAVLWRDRQYTRGQYQLAGIGMNVAGLLSMIWVLWRGTLLAPGGL